jgi:predicted lipoprotein with Yx(FWY)xxD motif
MTSRLHGIGARFGTALAAVGLAVGLAACSSDAGPSADDHGMTAEEHAQWQAEQAQGGAAAPEGGGHGGGHTSHGNAAPGSLELWAVQTRPFDQVVTDHTGQIVYRSDRDSNQPPTSTCVAAPCTATWEPLVIDETGEVVGLGVAEDDIGTLTRPDGTRQVTIAGWPAYTHAGDNGQLTDAGANGAEGVWFAIAPDGEKALPTAG